jgi:hypothetical protein
MLRVFADHGLQDRFEREGYVTVPLYGRPELKALSELYSRLHRDPQQEFFPSTYSGNPEYREVVDQEIRAVTEMATHGLLTSTQLRYASFIAKSPGPRGVVNVHQDMTLVDESAFSGINIWCPLEATTKDNGALRVIPGSHRWMETYRGSTIRGIYDSLRPQIQAATQPLYLAAGEAVIFDQSIIHYSPQNFTERTRVVTNVFFTRREARFQTAWFDRSSHQGVVELFEQESDFIGRFEQFGSDINARPRIGRSLGLFPYTFPQVDEALLEARCGSHKGA